MVQFINGISCTACLSLSPAKNPGKGVKIAAESGEEGETDGIRSCFDERRNQAFTG